MTTTTGIPTVFEATQYRSRLEARWAAFFGLIDWSYVYEPFDGAGYIPDFIVQVPGMRSPVLIEVKPAVTYDEYWEALTKAYHALPDWKHPVLVVGVNPYYVNPFNHTVGEGYLRGIEETAGVRSSPDKLRPPTAVWWLRKNGGITLRASYTAGGYVSGEHLSTVELDKLWREAGNLVQWRSPANKLEGAVGGA